MPKYNRTCWWACCLALCLLLPSFKGLLLTDQQALFINAVSDLSEGKSVPEKATASSWILKWKEAPDPAFTETGRILSVNPDTGLQLVAPAEGVALQEWVDRWSRSNLVQYLTPNQTLQAAAVQPNDPFLSRQKYLEQTHANEAWALANQNDNIVIALIDTGVDLDHVDLKDNLVPGTNLIQRNLPPRDDNGHGTSVAGVIAAMGNNNKGISGMLWKAKIMPIKALEPNGRGDEDKLGEGIRYAVDHGAKIVVLSVGLLRNDPYLEEIVQYAEGKGVLLIAATGNDEGEHVRYPAAYPSVLAVGGVRTNNQIEYRSNYGQEVDLVAPWSVYTTAPGSRYQYNEGTSMAAPQVAAAAALIWSRYPYMKVHEVRQLLRQTAEDVAEPGWDKFTGYGLLRVDRALSQPYMSDFNEPNESRAAAKSFPLNRSLSGELKDGLDADWLHIEAPYDGILQFALEADGPIPADVTWTHFDPNRTQGDTYPLGKTRMVEVHVSKGRNDFLLQRGDPAAKVPWTYRLTNTFHVDPDPFEDNDRQYKAFKLAARSQSLTGTFDHEGDQDWYSLTITKSGRLTVRLTPDTKRIDAVLKLQKKEEKLSTADDNGDGQAESLAMDVFPGTYYILADKTSAHPVNGTYSLDIDYEARLLDPNEPNDKSYQATLLGNGYELEGLIDDNDGREDADWYKFTVAEDSLLRLKLKRIPDNRVMKLDLLDNSLIYVSGTENPLGQTDVMLERQVRSGTYYIKLTAAAGFQDQLYGISLQVDKIVSGYIDITSHWARTSISNLTDRGITEGFGDYTFRPDQSLSRAEAVTMLVRAFGYSKRKTIQYEDLAASHWAFDAFSRAAQAGLVQGYPDGTLQPERALTRVEMTVMVANALGVGGKMRGNEPFADIADDYWAAPILKQMKMEGWISGYEDNTFRPELPCTRAEFAVLLSRILNQ